MPLSVQHPEGARLLPVQRGEVVEGPENYEPTYTTSDEEGLSSPPLPDQFEGAVVLVARRTVQLTEPVYLASLYPSTAMLMRGTGTVLSSEHARELAFGETVEEDDSDGDEMPPPLEPAGPAAAAADAVYDPVRFTTPPPTVPIAPPPLGERERRRRLLDIRGYFRRDESVPMEH